MTKKEHAEKEAALRKEYTHLESHYVEEKTKFEGIPKERQTTEPPPAQHPRTKFYNETLQPAYQSLVNKSIELNKHLRSKPDEDDKPAQEAKAK